MIKCYVRSLTTLQTIGVTLKNWQLLILRLRILSTFCKLVLYAVLCTYSVRTLPGKVLHSRRFTLTYIIPFRLLQTESTTETQTNKMVITYSQVINLPLL